MVQYTNSLALLRHPQAFPLQKKNHHNCGLPKAAMGISIPQQKI